MTNSTHATQANAPTGVLLAAGRGSRFSANTVPGKLLVRLSDGRPMITAVAEHLCQCLSQVVVVIQPDSTISRAVRQALAGLPLHIVENARAADGMGTSIAVGVTAAMRQFPDSCGWIMALGDMPFVQPRTIALIRDALSKNASGQDAFERETADIVAPGYQGQRGHPVGFAARHAAQLCALTGDQGARDLLRQHRVRLIETDDSGILRDIDTPDDLARHLHV